MRLLSLVVFLAAVISFVAFVTAETQDEKSNVKTIPLNQIWAFEMPGTRDVHELGPKPDGKLLPLNEFIRVSLVARTQYAISNVLNDGATAGPAFVVVGTDKEALKRAADILTKTEKPAEVFPPDTDLTLVFYSHACGRYVWIESVEQTDDRITVNYRFVSHRNRETTEKFALIPLGKLPEGSVQVEINQLPPTNLDKADPITPMPNPRRFVCDSFSFRVGK